MMTEESTMMPKSTAPIESRFADLPRKKSIEKANNSASGMLIATINAVRTLLKNIKQDHDDQADAHQQVLGHGVGRDAGQLRAVVVGHDLHARQHPPGRGVVEFLDLGLDVLQGRQGGLSLAQQHDAPHLVGIVVADLG